MTDSYTSRRGGFAVERPEGRSRRAPRPTPDIRRYFKQASGEFAAPVTPIRRVNSTVSSAEALFHLSVVARATTDTRPGLGERFEELRLRWEDETEFYSTAMLRYMHPAYQRIIGMGADVLPMILRALRDEPEDWYWALSAISGQDPAEGAETPSEARERWLEWGAEQGYLGW